jgi:hypothetical protein
METSIAERTTKVVRFSATGLVKSKTKSKKALGTTAAEPST